PVSSADVDPPTFLPRLLRGGVVVYRLLLHGVLPVSGCLDMSTVSPLPLLRNRVRVREAKKTARGSCRGNHGPPHQHTPPPRAPHPQEEGRESAEPLPLRTARLLEWLCPG